MTDQQIIQHINNRRFDAIRRADESQVAKAAAAIAMIILVIWGLVEVLEMVNACQL